jgi:spermidine/putrescine transport system ATP-binding protein
MPTMPDSVASVAISQVRKTYAGSSQPALLDVSLNILDNEFFTLLGPSGCGKTTLLRMIGGFEHPDAGSVALAGQIMGHTPPNKRQVNTVFQSYALFPHMSVAQNIAFALEMLDHPREAIRARVEEMMRLVQLTEMGDRKPAQLSGGQQQRVALGRALAPAPKVLLLDEPLSALDLKLRKEMQVELKRLQTATGITFVFVTHDQEEALTMSNRIAVMNKGEVMQVGRPCDIYDQPSNRFVAEFIGETNFLKAVCLERQGSGGTFRILGTAHESQPIAVDDAGTARAGDTVVLAIRPERITVASAASAQLHATVRETTYTGSDLMLHCALDDGTLLRTRLPSSAQDGAPTSGTVGLALPSKAIRVFAA